MFEHGPQLRTIDIIDVFEVGGRECWRYDLVKRIDELGEIFDVVHDAGTIYMSRDLWRNISV